MAISIPYSFTDGQTIVAAQHNSNFNAIASFVDALQAGTNFNANAIGTTSINDLAVTGGKIAGGAVTLDKLAAAVADALVPTGSIIAYAGNTAPSGWLLCDGAAFSSATYPALFAVLGNVATTPNLVERVPMGANGGTITARTSGGARKIGLNDLPAHSHPNTVASVTVAGTVGVTLGGGDHSHGASSGNTNLDHRHSAQAKQGAASAAHNGTTTFAAGMSASTGEAYPSTSFAESIVVGSMDHGHSITVNSANAGVSVSGTSFTQTSGSGTLTNANNATTHTDYYQPYYAVNYIIKAA
jgi:microcystin-dependent protein